MNLECEFPLILGVISSKYAGQILQGIHLGRNRDCARAKGGFWYAKACYHGAWPQLAVMSTAKHLWLE